jgi:hypothetical protein
MAARRCASLVLAATVLAVVAAVGCLRWGPRKPVLGAPQP